MPSIMEPTRRLAVALVLALVPAVALSQALPNLTLLRVRYNTQKTNARPQGELKAKIDALDKQIEEAARLGQNGELRRLFAKGTTLLAGKPWTEEQDFATSLVLRTDRIVADPTRPYSARLEQIYRPSIVLERRLTARVLLRRSGANSFLAAAPAETVVKDLGTLDGVGRDLGESPFPIEVDLSGVADGAYILTAEVFDQARSLGTAALGIELLKGLDALVARLEQAAANVTGPARDEILFPVDRVRNVNRGRIELRTMNVAAEFKGAEAVVRAVRNGSDPLRGRTGDLERHYKLEPAGEIMPYRLYVPTTYNRSHAVPLIIALHGLGATEDSFFDAYGKTLPKLAEQRGYVVAAPLGYRVDGFYGWGVATPPEDVVARRRQELSEQDVMEVLKQVRALYTIDASRIYLMGHSMGAIGTWRIASKYPDIWAALGPFSGFGSPATAERVRHIPQFVVHGDADPTVNVQGSRSMVEELKRLGGAVKYIEVAGGDHTNVVAPHLSAMFDFFEEHRKVGRTSP
jgi:poly(3-hydroxybutyrate) depolymerase